MKEDLSNLFVEERREKIFSIIEQNKRVTIAELVGESTLGEATIRRDLSALEKKGLIKRTHGGAILADKALEEIGYKIRESSNTQEKMMIANAFAPYVSNGEALFLDGGTTTQFVARALKSKSNLVIVTNSPALANELLGINGNTIILTGGELRVGTNVLVGPAAVSTLKQFRTDHVILGMSSLIPDQGFFTVNHYEAEIKRAMIGFGKETTIVMDSSKIGKVVFSFVCGFDKIDRVIIDSGVQPKVVEQLEKEGIEVIVAGR